MLGKVFWRNKKEKQLAIAKCIWGSEGGSNHLSTIWNIVNCINKSLDLRTRETHSYSEWFVYVAND